MASKGRKPKKPAPAVHPLSDDDCIALTAFCQTIDLADDVSLPAWESLHSDLDLCIPLFLTVAEAASGLEKVVNFCRTTRAEAKAPGTRNPASCLVAVPPQVIDGAILSLAGEGDRCGPASGNLRVIIRLKCSR